jgi:hypothetical protein
VEAKNVYRHLGLVKSEKGSQNCCGAKIMFVQSEIDVDINPLVNPIPNTPLPTPKGPDTPRAFPPSVRNESYSQGRCVDDRTGLPLQKVEPVSHPEDFAFEIGRAGRSCVKYDSIIPEIHPSKTVLTANFAGFAHPSLVFLRCSLRPPSTIILPATCSLGSRTTET